MHDAALVLGGHVHSGNVAEAHEAFSLRAERALVELDGLLGGSVEDEIRVELLDRYGFLLLTFASEGRSGAARRATKAQPR